MFCFYECSMPVMGVCRDKEINAQKQQSYLRNALIHLPELIVNLAGRGSIFEEPPMMTTTWVKK